MLLRTATLAAAVLVLAGCGGGGGSEGGTETGTATQPRSQLPPGCEVAVVERAVDGFLGAVSSGSRASIAARVSPAGDFVRLTTIAPDGTRYSTADRGAAVAHLAGRSETGERLRLLSLRVARGVDANHVTVTGAVTRTATDTGRHVAVFDGAVNCVRGSITRWRLQPSGG